MPNKWADRVAPTGPSSDLVDPSRSTGLSTGSLERLLAPEVASRGSREASERRFGVILGLIWGRFSIVFRAFAEKLTPCRLKDLTCILRMRRKAASRHVALFAPESDLGTLFRSFWTPWHPLGPPFGRPEGSLGRLGPLLGRSEGALGSFLGALGAHLEPPEGSRPLPGPIWGGFWVDLEVNWGWFGNRFQ